MQVAPPSFLQYVLQATELLYIQRLQPNQFVPRHQRHLLRCVHSSMPAKSSSNLLLSPWWLRKPKTNVRGEVNLTFKSNILDNYEEIVSSIPRILNVWNGSSYYLSYRRSSYNNCSSLPHYLQHYFHHHHGLHCHHACTHIQVLLLSNGTPPNS